MIYDFFFSVISGLGAMLGWGIADFFAKKTVDKIGNILALFWMQVFGIIPLLLIFLFNFDISKFSLIQIPYVILWGLIDGGGYLMFYRALEKGKVSIISPIVASYSAFSVLISAIVFKEKLPSRILLILGMIFIGIMLTSIDYKGIRKKGFEKKDLIYGVPEALLGVVLFSIWFPFWDNFVSSGNWLFLVILLRFVIVLLLFTIVKFSRLSIIINNLKVIKWLIVIGLLDGAAYLILSWGYGMTKYTSLITLLSSAFSLPTLLLARIFLKEKLQLFQSCGIILILLGVILLSLNIG